MVVVAGFLSVFFGGIWVVIDAGILGVERILFLEYR
jgi:hypothetical protein